MAPLSRRAIGWAANAHQLTITNAVLISVTAFIVGLRFLARRKLKNKLGLDDLFALLAFGMYLAHVSTNFRAAHKGTLDINPKSMSLKKIVDSLKLAFVNIYIMAFTISFARLSVIFLYNRIFGVYSGFRKLLWLNGILSAGWLITIIFLNSFRCRPIEAAWNPLIKNSCLDLQVLFLYTESLNCALDLALVLLPVFKINKLNLSLRDRLALSVVFLAGGFVCLTSIMRIIFTYHYYPASPILSGFWLTLQLAFAIICACLPTLRSFLPKRVPVSLPKYLISWREPSASTNVGDETQKGKKLSASTGSGKQKGPKNSDSGDSVSF